MVSEQLNQTESMKTQLNKLLTKTNVVGVIASEADMSIALKDPHIADIFEWRVDHVSSEVVEDGIRELNRPVILTVRAGSEGGKQPQWMTENRIALYRQYLNLATFVDIEASTAHDMTDVIMEARQQNVGVIISQHVFLGKWYRPRTENAAKICAEFQGDIFKVALLPNDFNEACEFFGCLPRVERLSKAVIAPMIMGQRFGKVSRLLLGLSDSVPLIYCYLGKAQVVGQWSAFEIREMLEKMK